MVQIITEQAQIPKQGNVVIDFFATWCGPCQMIAPKYEQLAEKFPTITFLKVDCDQSSDLAEAFGVRSLPTFVFLKSGKQVTRISGADLNKLIGTLEILEED